MASEWEEVTVGEIAAPLRNALVGGPFGSNLVSSDYVPVGIPVIRGQNMGGRWVSGEFVYVSPEKAFQLSANTGRPGDLVFTQRGTLGQVALIPDEPYEAYIISQSQMKLTVDQHRADALFLYYCFSAPDQQEHITRHTIQTGVPHTNLGLLRDMAIRLPPLPEQRTIARILGALDDKIELNRRMNATLEALARALFTSWFVDFDPVRARAEGRQPAGMDAATAALFPDGFEESAIGPTPRGWEVTCLDTAAAFIKGVSYTSDDLRDSDAALVTLKSVGRGGGYQPQGLKPYIGAWKPEQELRPGELVVAHTDLTQAGEVLGRVARIPRQAAYRTLVASLDLTIVRPRSPAVSPEYLQGLLSSQAFTDHAAGYANGTTVLHLSAKALPRFEFVCPPPQVVEAFTDKVAAVHELEDSNEGASVTLAAIRDTLLPKLLSGEVRVREAETMVEARV